MKLKFLTVVSLGMTTFACHHSKPRPLENKMFNANDMPNPGKVQFSYEPNFTDFIDMTFTIKGGSAFNLVQCAYTITDDTAIPPNTFAPLNFYILLNRYGEKSLTISSVQCSNGNNANPTLTWSCQNTVPPNTESTVISSDGQKIILNCPTNRNLSVVKSNLHSEPLVRLNEGDITSSEALNGAEVFKENAMTLVGETMSLSANDFIGLSIAGNNSIGTPLQIAAWALRNTLADRLNGDYLTADFNDASISQIVSDTGAAFLVISGTFGRGELNRTIGYAMTQEDGSFIAYAADPTGISYYAPSEGSESLLASSPALFGENAKHSMIRPTVLGVSTFENDRDAFRDSLFIGLGNNQ